MKHLNCMPKNKLYRCDLEADLSHQAEQSFSPDIDQGHFWGPFNLVFSFSSVQEHTHKLKLLTQNICL